MLFFQDGGRGTHKVFLCNQWLFVPKDASFRDSVCSDETCFSKRDLPLSRSFVVVVAVFDEIKGQLFIIREVLDI